MLDKRCLSVLEYIDKECLNCGYKVFEIEDIKNAIPQEFGMEGENIVECIKTLSEHDYISVKYSDENEVCLSPLSKGRVVFENRIDVEIEKESSARKYFKFAFLGAVSGGVAFAIIILIILLATGVI